MAAATSALIEYNHRILIKATRKAVQKLACR